MGELRESHPITFQWVRATVIAVAACIGASVATFGVVLGWLDGRYVLAGGGPFQTEHDAEKQLVVLKQELTARGDQRFIELNGRIATTNETISTLAQAVKARNEADERTGAGYSSRLTEIMMDRASARIDDCKEVDLVIAGHKAENPIEAKLMEHYVKSCARFARDEAQATRRYENAQNDAQKTWRAR
jgi:hypothetical protein